MGVEFELRSNLDDRYYLLKSTVAKVFPQITMLGYKKPNQDIFGLIEMKLSRRNLGQIFVIPEHICADRRAIIFIIPATHGNSIPDVLGIQKAILPK